MIRAEIRPARMNSAILEQEFLARQKGGQNGPPASPADSFPDLADLRRSASDVSESASLLGRMPPKPPTVRGSVGAILIRLIQRALFWYTPRLERFQLATANLASKQVGFLQEQARTIREQGNAIFKFEASLAQWESRERDLMNRVSELESDAAEMRSQWLIERKHRRELEDRLRSILHVFESLDLP
ncbi:MAG TPA: hypothetical protein VM120_22615, partial [Bryobacteraceae bacterium]|nr:hypothetical protein [Bryobacteraceae bacterium]